jgi:formiminotetrahydrofolate cyclodeaminase
LEVAEKCVLVMALAERCVALGNLNAVTDAASAGTLAYAGMSCAGYNVRINLTELDDKMTGESLLAQLHTIELRARRLSKELRNTLSERGGI